MDFCHSHEHIVNSINTFADFITKHTKIVNAHMVDFITRDHWNLIDPNIQFELLSLPEEDLSKLCNDEFIEKVKRNMPHTCELIGRVKSLLLTHYTTKLLQLWDPNSDPKYQATVTHHFARRCLPPKKIHEVNIMASFIASLARRYGIQTVLDFGSGKGYLSTYLSLLHGLDVVGVDASDTNTSGATTRNAKLIKYFEKVRSKIRATEKALTTEENALDTEVMDKLNIAEPSAKKAESERKEEEPGKFLPITEYVDPKTDLGTLVARLSPQVDRFLMCGLHTCGNLTPTIFHHFVQCGQAPLLVHLGCCYHLLTEEFEEPYQDRAAAMFGFPLSENLRKRRFTIGYNARNLSSHCWDRFNKKAQASNRAVFYRAVLQVILTKHLGYIPEDHPVGRLGAKCGSFLEYCRRALEKLGHTASIPLTDEQIEDYLQRYARYEHLLNCFQQIRIILAPCVESVIVLDRLLFLSQQPGIKKVRLIEMFDPETSPRCYAFLAVKELD